MNRWFALSLAANLILAVGLLSSRVHPVPSMTVAPVVTLSKPGPAPSRTVVPVSAGGDWHSWIGPLRAAGVPARVLAGLVASDFESRWDDRQRELQRRYEKGDIDSDALAQAAADHDAEREKELRLVLGDEGFRQWDQEQMFRDLNVAGLDLSGTESGALYQLRKDMLAQRKQWEDAARRGDIDEAELAGQLASVQAQYDQKAKELLGDSRYTAMNTSPDPTVAELKRQVKGMNVSDDQMTALLQAQEEWNRQRARLTDDAPGYDDDMQALDRTRDAAFQKILGADGYAAYQKQQDAAYQTLKRYANAWQLAPGDVDYLYGAIRDYNRNVQGYRDRAKAMEAQGQAVDWDGVQKNIDVFSRQTEESLGFYLGTDRLSKMKQNDVFNFSFQD